VETTLPQFGRLVKAPAFVVMHHRYGFELSALQAPRFCDRATILSTGGRKNYSFRRTMTGTEIDEVIIEAVAAETAGADASTGSAGSAPRNLPHCLMLN
jgi:hypothetical protein